MAISGIMPRFVNLLSLAVLLGGAMSAKAEMVTPVVIDPGRAFGGLTADGVNVYAIAGGSIFSVPIGGGTLTTLYSGLTSPTRITNIGSNLFWIDPNSGPVTDTQILMAPKAGGGPVTAIYTGVNVGQPIVDGSGIITDGTRLYTADEVQGRVHSLNPDGTGLTQLDGERYGGFFDREHFNSIAVKDGIVYIADQGRAGFSDTPPRIESIPAGGGSFTTLFTGNPAFAGIAVSSDSIFLTSGNQIYEMPRTGGTPTPFVSDPRFGRLSDLTLFDDALYVADTAGAIWKVGLTPAVAAPEPASLTLLGVGAFALLGYGCRRRKKARLGAESIQGSSTASPPERLANAGISVWAE